MKHKVLIIYAGKQNKKAKKRKGDKNNGKELDTERSKTGNCRRNR